MPKLSKGFYLGSIISGIVVTLIISIMAVLTIPDLVSNGKLNFSGNLARFVILMVIISCWALYAAVVSYILIYKMWAAIQDGYARTTPGKAVGFLFIPFFNIYWIFQVVWGFAQDYNKYIQRHALAVQPLSESLFLACPLLMIAGIIPCVGPLAGLAQLVVWLIIVAQICDAVNALDQELLEVGEVAVVKREVEPGTAIYCPSCGSQSVYGMFYCSNCGTQLVTDSVATSPPNPNPQPEPSLEPVSVQQSDSLFQTKPIPEPVQPSQSKSFTDPGTDFPSEPVASSQPDSNPPPFSSFQPDSVQQSDSLFQTKPIPEPVQPSQPGPFSNPGADFPSEPVASSQPDSNPPPFSSFQPGSVQQSDSLFQTNSIPESVQPLQFEPFSRLGMEFSPEQIGTEEPAPTTESKVEPEPFATSETSFPPATPFTTTGQPFNRSLYQPGVRDELQDVLSLEPKPFYLLKLLKLPLRNGINMLRNANEAFYLVTVDGSQERYNPQDYSGSLLSWADEVMGVMQEAENKVKAGQFVEAQTILLKALRLAPGSDILMLSLGICLAQQQEFAKAVKVLERAQELYPDNPGISRNLEAIRAEQ